MGCCSSSDGMDRFFSRGSARYAKRFRRKGPDKTSRLLLQNLSRSGVASKRVLDIGCGTGGIHLSLLQSGAAFAEGVDVSLGMLEQAGALATELGVRNRVRYTHGDFAALSNVIEEADIVVLDKVLCCYADPFLLIRESTKKAKALLALSYPRSSWIAAVGFGFMHWLGGVLGWSFRPFYHDPGSLGCAVERNGFGEVFSGQTLIWQLKVYERITAIPVKT